MQDKNSSNRFNLKNGIAFAYRIGDIVEKTVGSALSGTPLEAPILNGKPRAGAWYRIPLEKGMSGDGSGYYIYLRKGGSRNLCIFFSGGGLAWNEYTAARPVSGGKLTAGMPNYYWNNLRPFTQIMNIRTGLTDTSNPMNLFRFWNFIVVTYATGDLHVGSHDFPYKAEDGSLQLVHFHGHRNFEAAMEKAKVYFPEAEKLLIAGDSAGAFAVPALTDEILENVYPDCRDVTVFSDSGQLLYPHWRKTAREVWKADEKIWKALHTPNITMDWYHSLYGKYGGSIRYLYASSTRDYLLSAYYNDIARRKYSTDEDVQEEFFRQLCGMLEEFREMAPRAGFFIDSWPNFSVYPGLRGGTVHTAVRQKQFFWPNADGRTMMQWLFEATEGKVGSSGLKLLKK